MKFTTRGQANLLINREHVQDSTPFASLGWGILGPGPNKVQCMKEERTGTEFPGEFCLRSGQRQCLKITGTGVRTKKVAIKTLNIYALALYVDEQAIKSALHRKYKDKPVDQIAKDATLFKDVIKLNNAEKSLVLVMTSKFVNRKNFLDALNDRLVSPLTKAREAEVLDLFTSQFDNINFKKGLELSFTFTHGYKVVTKADGKVLGTIGNKILSDTLLDCYLGSNPVSLGAKIEFAKGLSRMIS